MKYLKQFVVGSCAFVFLPFFYNLNKIIEKKKSEKLDYLISNTDKSAPFWWPKEYNYYSYERYTLTAPIYFGIWNIISLIISEKFNISMRNRFIIISIISSLYTMTLVTYYNMYDYKIKREYIRYYIKIFISYMIIWNIVIYNIEKYI